jgi:hypothetical protein
MLQADTLVVQNEQEVFTAMICFEECAGIVCGCFGGGFGQVGGVWFDSDV